MSAMVSIIIPVYNLENYIENCLNSIINQTYKELEILCIDDGSKDRSGEIITKMTENDNRIVYIRQENAGVSAARNNGLDHAKGEYIMFADGDDYMHYQAVELLVKCIEEKQCNMIFGGSVVTPKTDYKMNEITSFSYTEIIEETLFDDGPDMAVWGKIFKKEILSDMRFLLGITNAEDYNFMLRLMYKTKNDWGYRIDPVVYYYFVRGDSASLDAFSKKNITEIYANEKNAEFFYDKEDSYLNAQSLKFLLKAMFFVRTKSIATPFEKEAKTAVKNAWKRNRSHFYKASKISLLNKIVFTVFYYSRHAYELFRVIQDPTMKDFYKNRKNKRS